jgi:hypothetical protein
MLKSNHFREFATEALVWVAQSKIEEERQLLLELVHTWTEAAVVSESILQSSGASPRPGR